MQDRESEKGGAGAESPPEARRWAATDIGKNWQLRFFHNVIRFCGRQAAYQVMYFVVLWYVMLSPEIRRRTRYYLDRRFPWRKGAARELWDSYRLVCSFGHMLIDQAAVMVKGPDSIGAVCTNEAEMKRAVAGRGAVLLVSHLGCWQIAMTALGFIRKPVSAVMMPQGEDSPVTGMIQDRLDFRIIDPRKGMESILEMMQALRGGGILTIMGDRAFGGPQNSLSTVFLGETISLPASPYRLAGAAGAPILVLQAARLDQDRYEITLARVIGVEKKGGADEGCRHAARLFAETMEEFVRRHPWQFFNFFDLWEDRG